MNRRTFIIRSAIGIPTGVITLSAFKCGKDDLLYNAEIIISSLRSATPLIGQFLPSAIPKLNLILPIADKLREAVAANNATEAIGFLRQMIPAFDDIILHDIPSLKIEIQTKVLAALALADIGLGFLSVYYKKNQPPMSARSGRDVIAEYAARERWGQNFKRK